MKTRSLFPLMLFLTLCCTAGEDIPLPPVSDTPGLSTRQAFQERRSCRTYRDEELPLETLSDLLWSANGFNRPGMRTNATGLNKQTVELYVCMKSGAYRYDAAENTLRLVASGDLRPAAADRQGYAATAPVILHIVSDVSDPVYDSENGRMLAAYDAGIVSGNIYLFCAANGLATVCRMSMDREKLRAALGLPETKILHLNHPVGFPGESGGEKH